MVYGVSIKDHSGKLGHFSELRRYAEGLTFVIDSFDQGDR